MKASRYILGIVLTAFFMLSYNALQAQDQPKEKGMIYTEDRNSVPKSQLKKHTLSQRKNFDPNAIRKMHKESSISSFINSFKSIKGLKDPKCSSLDNQYYCYYTPSNNNEKAIINKYINDRAIVLTKHKVQSEESEDVNGNPVFRLHKPGASNFVLIAPRRDQPAKAKKTTN